MEHWRTHEAVQTVCAQGASECGHGIRVCTIRTVEVLHRLARARVDEVEATKCSDAAPSREGGILVHEPGDLLLHDWFDHVLGVVDQIVLEHVLDALVANSQRHGVCVESGSPAKSVGLKMLLDVIADCNHGQRHVGARQALGARDDVGDYVVVLETPELPGPTEARHHLIADHQDSVLVAEGSHPFHVALRGQVHASGADHRLEHDRGDAAGALADDLLLQEGQRLG
mmetsp:Transcript_87963/g.228177  ORF Transcript_87963/g.228177 Transcript_87963/m.228177 type:complete len:228 (-) Transcript_87963:921-1604(-)